jgi:hypothetical protein
LREGHSRGSSWGRDTAGAAVGGGTQQGQQLREGHSRGSSWGRDTAGAAVRGGTQQGQQLREGHSRGSSWGRDTAGQIQHEQQTRERHINSSDCG